MLSTKRPIQISLLIMVCTSGLLLGLSQDNLSLSALAVVGAIVAFIVTDYMEWFRLNGWMANIASIAVLLMSMSGFIEGDGAAKLIAVSNLLVYLQTVLMFQIKTPRLNWQVMVLSLLQVVVAAIFNLNFEGGLLFVLYFGIAGITMIFQALFSGNWDTVSSNRIAARRVRSHLNSLETSGSDTTLIDQQPITFHDVNVRSESAYSLMFRHAGLWLLGGLVFSTIMFYLIPRSNEAWFGPQFKKSIATGANKKLDLAQKGKLRQTEELVFRTWFEDPITSERVRIRGEAYFRDLALSSLVVEDGITTWKAPYDRIYDFVYRKIPARSLRGRNFLYQHTTLEPTVDPLIHVCMPTFADERTPHQIEFCLEISAFTRKRESERIEISPFKYRMRTLVNRNNELLQSWPFISGNQRYDRPLSQSPGRIKWLTYMDKQRYPGIVSKANEIAAAFETTESETGETSVKDRIGLIRAMEEYLQSDEFQYTVDLTDVELDDTVDPTEDFFSNHKSGHCQFFSSALALMLRSQGIPARVVVGFYGGEYNDLTESYMVRANHAHAWVEAYVRPEDCTKEMFATGAASRRAGAWLIADGTPASAHDEEATTSGDTMEAARTMWQEYVLGLSSQNQNQFEGRTSDKLLGLLDLSNWGESLQVASSEVSRRPWLRVVLLLLTLISIFVALLWNGFFSNEEAIKQSKPKANVFRRLVGSAISWIAPDLGKWVMGESPQQLTTGFYRRLVRILEKNGFSRRPDQTQREFARIVSGQLAQQSPDREKISVIGEVTEMFYCVRFGELKLDKQRIKDLDQRLAELEQGFKNSEPLATSAEMHSG